MNTAARKSTKVPVSRDVNEDKKWGRFTSVVYAAMGSPLAHSRFPLSARFWRVVEFSWLRYTICR